MADFCKECSEDLFGPELETPFSDLITQKQIDAGLCMPVLCESCGPIFVGPEGERLNELDQMAEQPIES